MSKISTVAIKIITFTLATLIVVQTARFRFKLLAVKFKIVQFGKINLRLVQRQVNAFVFCQFDEFFGSFTLDSFLDDVFGEISFLFVCQFRYNNSSLKFFCIT